jgi:hypothetical protein
MNDTINIEQIRKKFSIARNNGELKQLEKLSLNDLDIYQFKIIGYDNLNDSLNSLNSSC